MEFIIITIPSFSFAIITTTHQFSLIKCQAMKIGPLYPLIFFYYENEKDNYEIDSFNSFKSNSGGQKCLIHTKVVQHSAGLNQYFVLVPLNRGALL